MHTVRHGQATALGQETTKKHRNDKRLDVQGLRAIAVVLVIIEHTRWGLTGGFIGVDVFFVISGFVITLSLLRELGASNRVSFRSFFRRRIFRLMPAATAMTLGTALLSILLVSPLGLQQQTAATGGAAMVWLSNVALYFINSDYFSPHVQANPFLHTWSLGVEEQFYIFFPLLIALGWAVGRSLGVHPKKMLLAVIIVVGSCSFAFSLTTSGGNTLGFISNPDQFAFYMMPTRAWEFTVGVLLALLLSWGKAFRRMPARLATGLASLGLGMIAVSAIVIDQGMRFPGFVALLPVLGTAVVIFAGAKPNGINQALSWFPLQWIGDRTYSLYLWHWPMIVFARRLWPESELAMIGAVAVAVILADLTFKFIEEPTRKLGYKPLSKRIVFKSASLYIVACTSCFVLLAGSLHSWNNPDLQAVTDQLNERPEGYNVCLSATPISQRDLDPCTWGDSRHGEPIYLMGDSNAQQYTEAIIGAADALNRPLLIATWGGCQFFNPQREDLDDPTKGKECATYVEDGTEWLLNQTPGTVLLANAGTAITDKDITLDGESDPVVKSEIWSSALQDQILTLQAGGHNPILIAKTPHFPDSSRGWWHPADCSNYELVNDPESCAAVLSSEAVAQQRQPTLEAELYAAQATGIPMIDPSESFCAEECSTYNSGTWVYRDGLHISPSQSRDLVEWFTLALEGN